jgi:hypothetical protein
MLLGALFGAVGSLTFILRSLSDSKGRDPEAPSTQRRMALKSVTGVYALIAWGCLVVALALGDSGFIVTTALTAFIATLALLLVWRHQGASQEQ